MKASRWTIVACLFVLLAVVGRWLFDHKVQMIQTATPSPSATQPAQPAPAAQPAPGSPVWDWKEKWADRFPLAAGGFMAGYHIPAHTEIRSKVEIQAKAPVKFSYVPSVDEPVERAVLAQHDSSYYPCLQNHILHKTYECRFNTGDHDYSLLIQDERTEGHDDNDVIFRYSTWSCVSNCDQQRGQIIQSSSQK